jgi:hypothetical protein
MKSNVICPHCKTELEINYTEGEMNKQQKYKCYKCKKTFYFTPEISDNWFDIILGFIIILGILIGSILLIYLGITKTISLFSDNETSNFQKQQELIAQQQYEQQKAKLNAEQAETRRIQAEINKLKQEIANKELEKQSEQNQVKQYTSKVLFDDSQFRTKAKEITSGCNGEQECQLYKIYRYIVTNFEYYSDPRNNEYIQNPYETWNSQGGDCEDLGILLQTLLESIGIKTLSAFTTNHYYVLGCIENTQKVLFYTNKDTLNLYNKYYESINYYKLDNLRCIPLEPTAKNSYPGISTWNYSTAYDPLTLKKYLLD